MFTRGIVWHATSGPGTNAGQYEGTIGWFQRGPQQRTPPSYGSAHVVFDWDGSHGCITVPLEARAYHVATPGYNSEWLGVELSRRAPLSDPPPWPDDLWPRLATWALEMGQRFGFDARHPRSHRTHAEIQPADRTDPGPWFRLDRLLEAMK